jgi:quercetin dioxygenase-like cupin family protein
MRVTIFQLDGDDVHADVIAEPAWKPFEEWEGQPLDGVQLVELMHVPRAELQQVHIRAGGHFVMHTSPDLAFCQIVRGRGVLQLPDGRRLPYNCPELYVFQPGTLHEWTDIEEDTLLSVCLLRRPADE